MAFNHIDRAHLVDALETAGPHAPTLCEGWLASHLAAHVVLRESAPLLAAGLLVPALAQRTDRAIDELAEASSDEAGWADLVARVAAGPRGINPLAWGGDRANLVEFVVHTEDVRRGAGPAAQLERSAEHLDAIWALLRPAARLRYRKSGVGVVLVVPGGRRSRVRSPRGGAGTIVLRGSVVDLLLHASGRREASGVLVEGAPRDVEEFGATEA